MQWNADLYNEKHAFVYQFGSQIIDLLKPQTGEVILDLGCGSGELTKAIKDSGAETYGVDSSPEMISKAKANYPEINFRVMDAAALDFDFKFDAVFSNAVFHWIENPEKAVEKMFENLKDGGRIVMEFGGKGNVQNIVESVRISLAKRNLQFYDPWYFPSIGEFASLLENKGFKVAYAEHFPRETELADENTGIADWLEMFGKQFFSEVKESDKSLFLQEITDVLRPANYRNGKWYADYKRIRIFAVK
jgi:trans-aconitate methyltransferase